ncbi:putative baseplate assembly protein [Rhodanobacter glycinis]|uniref:Putative baseplate assembly protein n=1 Tax=Rhodanobacter glycinis TaxID=582702 RepID=A0A502CH53_9GAMM|nr:putative baseplate assembly protein [Rhodanobacter glycinis]TPG11061.1 putative baseplate assembly protein [Rhodanobacter glycinis]TPG48549.1 putative baseplate assembly protein [Rhodanobacter glycinis]
MNTASRSASLGAIGCAALPACSVPARREKLRLSGNLNGIDYVEVGDDGSSLCVHLFGEIPQGIGVANVRISGGDRITGLRVLSVNAELEPDMHDDACLRVVLDREGDHTAYCLCLVDAVSGNDPAGWLAYPGFDPRYACVALHFRLDCAKTLDCAEEAPCARPPLPAPEINYLAKDYASFRQLFLDQIALDMPAWQEQHVPDIGIALVETLAYTADYLSYYQDAVATEAYLGTARRRISVRRHARLVDYRMHEGCNARALVVLASDTDLGLELDNLLLLVPPPGQNNAKPGVIGAVQLDAARTQGALVFEPMSLDGMDAFNVVAAQSAIRLHRWSDEMCCLPRGSTRATLVDAPPSSSAPPAESTTPSTSAAANDPAPVSVAAAAVAQRALKLAAGDMLIFEEVLGPQTGNPADADPAHRHAVRLTDVQTSVDPFDGTLLLEIAWDACDALPFDLCLSVRTPSPDCTWLHDVSLARGNVLLVDHGGHVRGQCTSNAICVPSGGDGEYPGLAATLAALPDACPRCHDLAEDCWLVPGATQYGCCHCDGAVQDVRRPPTDTGHVLPGTPLTWAEPLPTKAPVCRLFARDPRRALPQLSVYGGALGDVLMAGAPDPRWQWQPQYDLLGSGPDDRHFVVEIDDDGAAHLRFGDGVLGAQPQAGDFFRAAPRLGNGPSGNVGRDSIVWLALKSGELSADLQPRNPLPASGGTAAESLAEVKRYAPGAFRANPLRAIVADDYAMFAARAPELQGAAAALEWSGSWHAADVVVDPLGRESLPAGLAQRIRAELERYRRIGHDVEVRGACYVPLQIELFVCVLPNFLVAHVEAELRDRFSASLRRDGTPGFFHPDRLRLGAPVFASALLAEAQAITGVAHVEITTLARADDVPAGGVPADGVLHLAAREIAQVDNDPDHPDHGSIAFTLGGGR